MRATDGWYEGVAPEETANPYDLDGLGGWLPLGYIINETHGYHYHRPLYHSPPETEIAPYLLGWR